MHGDWLLLALDALKFFWETMDGFAHLSCDDMLEHNPYQNPRGFSYHRAKRVFSRVRYHDASDPIDVGEMCHLRTLHRLLQTTHPHHGLSTITVDVLTMLTSPDDLSQPMDNRKSKERAAIIRTISPLLNFLADIESGRLTAADFQEAE